MPISEHHELNIRYGHQNELCDESHRYFNSIQATCKGIKPINTCDQL